MQVYDKFNLNSLIHNSSFNVPKREVLNLHMSCHATIDCTRPKYYVTGEPTIQPYKFTYIYWKPGSNSGIDLL